LNFFEGKICFGFFFFGFIVKTLGQEILEKKTNWKSARNPEGLATA